MSASDSVVFFSSSSPAGQPELLRLVGFGGWDLASETVCNLVKPKSNRDRSRAETAAARDYPCSPIVRYTPLLSDATGRGDGQLSRSLARFRTIESTRSSFACLYNLTDLAF